MKKLKMDELDRLSVEGFKKVEKIPVVIVMDNIRSSHNVGSMFRTSDAFRVDELILCGITNTPPHKDIEKTALGATRSLTWRYFKETMEAIDALKADGYTILAIEQAEESIMLDAFPFPSEEKLAFVFGNEVFGVDDEVMKKVDACIEIPQFGTKHSFNVVVSAGIILWDYYSKTLKK
ncbi:MAG: 23S rRNA (guanosine2251-2'-O)-methyltransferase [Sphingobacteriales bacterium]|jgi:23S rRNA (guanosine2251-2'-O)-methyltransferase